MKWSCPLVRLINIINVTIKTSSSHWWKQSLSAGWAPKVQLKRGKNDNMSKEVKTTQWVHPLQQLTWANGCPPTTVRQERNQHQAKLNHLDGRDSCMAGVDCGATGSGTRIYSYFLYWHFGNRFFLEGYLTQQTYRPVHVTICSYANIRLFSEL